MRYFVASLGLLSACTYEPAVEIPINPATGEPDAASNVISGTVVLAGPVETIGPVMLFVSAASNPMPPYGTGSPISVGTVPANRFTSSGTGIQSAPFSVSGVPDGEYVITALMDVDGDFSPIIEAMSGATCGDIAGAHLTNLQGSSFGVVDVADGGLAQGVTVVLGSTLPLERPAFTLDNFGAGGGVVASSEAALDPTSQTFSLTSTGVHSAIYDLAGPEDFGTAACGTILPLYAPDADNNGQFDPHPKYAALGLKDVWPKVYLEYLGQPTLADGSVTFDSGLAPGERWAAESVPSPAYLALGDVEPGGTTFESQLEFVWLPAAQHTTVDASGIETVETVQDPSQIPKGAWAITLVSFTGQTWTVPNELAAFPAIDPSFVPSKQVAWIEVQ